jgi:hypothetical protein
MDPTTHARVARFGEELLAVMQRHLDQLDHHAVDFAWRGVFALLLATMVRLDQMSPNEMEGYLDNVFTELRALTQRLVREGEGA